mmetsp:Transcript_42544/g.63112  ORF Transcript_42544/g.63112 Transcript_42544/m.63112 type:complete len:98 (+) Transcript_42544:569-862(+)
MIGFSGDACKSFSPLSQARNWSVVYVETSLVAYSLKLESGFDLQSVQSVETGALLTPEGRSSRQLASNGNSMTQELLSCAHVHAQNHSIIQPSNLFE